MHQAAFKVDAVVGEGGRLEVTIPVAQGTPVEVLVLAPPRNEFSDLVEAASSSLDFWNNPEDEAAWNNA
jgi:hypothetical protein